MTAPRSSPSPSRPCWAAGCFVAVGEFLRGERR